MRDWLIYCGVFACALGTAICGYLAGFTKIMTGVSHGIEGFVLYVVILPLLAATVVFGVTCRALANRRFTLRAWVTAVLVVAVAAAGAFAVTATGVLKQSSATLLLLLALFVGGRVMFSRGQHA